MNKPLDVIFLYWAHNDNNEKFNFILGTFYDIGTKIRYNDEWVTIDDVAYEIRQEVHKMKSLYAFDVEVSNEWCNNYRSYELKGMLFAESYSDAAKQIEKYFKSELVCIKNLYAYGEYEDEDIFISTEDNIPRLNEMLECALVYKNLPKE